MSRSIRVAAVQLAANDRHAFAHALERAHNAAQRAAAVADIVVLPEGTLPAYVLGHEPYDDAPVLRAIERFAELARTTDTVIVAGAALRIDGGVRNAAVVIDSDGSLAGRADKIFLWHFDRRWFARGAHLRAIDTRAGRLGVLICADGRLPTIARALVDDGAALLVMPTAWVTSGRDPNALENVQADLLARVRAYENGVPFVAANKCGTELGMVAYCGKSQIVDRRGEVVAIAAQHEPAILDATLELADAARARTATREPARRSSLSRAPLRIAISFEPLPSDIDARLDLLDDAFALCPHDPARLARLDATLATAAVEDATVTDPAGLVAYRRAGYALAVWTSTLPAEWNERLARARAVELRIYIVVFDRTAHRAYAVDPDGSIIAGTFGGYRLASFGLDPAKVAQTIVAPGTDVAAGLERVAALADA